MFTKLLRAFKSSKPGQHPRNLYSVLGISESSSESQVKNAYFSQAKKLHPDINKSPDAKEKFSELNSAYEILSDPKQRRDYNLSISLDSHPTHFENSDFSLNPDPPPKSSKAKDFSDFEDTSSKSHSSNDYFTDFEGFSYNPKDFDDFPEFTSKKKHKSKKGEDVSLTVEVPFLDTVKGTNLHALVKRKKTCKDCKGKKLKEEVVYNKCSHCKGQGLVFAFKEDESVQVLCQHCQGSGCVPKSPCLTCGGQGFEYKEELESILVPSGVEDGQCLKIVKKGNYSVGGGDNGDLYVNIKVIPHPVFRREGQNVLSDVFISVSQAVLGDVIDVETAFGVRKIQIEPGTNADDRKRIASFGIPHPPPNSHKRGEHVITIKLKLPQTLSQKHRKIFEQLSLEDDNSPNTLNLNKFKAFYK